MAPCSALQNAAYRSKITGNTEGRECIAYNHWFDSLDERDQKCELAAIKRRYYAYYEDRIARAKKHHEDIMRRPEPPSPKSIPRSAPARVVACRQRRPTK